MSVLFAGTELDAFVVLTTAPFVNTSSAFYDADFSRSALEYERDVTSWRTASVGDVAEAWFHLRQQNFNIAVGSRTMFSIRNSSDVEVFRLFASSTSQLQYQYWNGSSFTNIGSSFSEGDFLLTIDIHALINDSTGVFEIYHDGSLYASFGPGDTNLFGGSALDHLAFFGTANATDNDSVSEVIIADEETLGWRLATLPPDGNGAETAWTGDYTDVDESGIDDGDFISSDTADQVETFTLSNLSAVAQAFDVKAVVASARARRGSTGPQNLQLAVRTNATNYFSSSKTLTTSFQGGYQNVWDQNPDTTSPWTVSDVQGLEAGVKSIT